MVELDRELLAAIGRPRPRVVVIPTAAAPDGETVFRRWADMGIAHFEALGAEVEPVLARNTEEGDDEAAIQAIGEADLIYLSGGSPSFLADVLTDSRLGWAIADAHDRGAVIAGCSAGAMVLGGRLAGLRRRMLPWPLRWSDGLGLVPGVAVLPHYDAWPEPLTALMALQAPAGIDVIGIDEDTALVGRDRAWRVHGVGRVTVWQGRRRTRYRRGDVVRL